MYFGQSTASERGKEYARADVCVGVCVCLGVFVCVQVCVRACKIMVDRKRKWYSVSMCLLY